METREDDTSLLDIRKFSLIDKIIPEDEIENSYFKIRFQKIRTNLFFQFSSPQKIYNRGSTVRSFGRGRWKNDDERRGEGEREREREKKNK